jgi:hypothetical protein
VVVRHDHPSPSTSAKATGTQAPSWRPPDHRGHRHRGPCRSPEPLLGPDGVRARRWGRARRGRTALSSARPGRWGRRPKLRRAGGGPFGPEQRRIVDGSEVERRRALLAIRGAPGSRRLLEAAMPRHIIPGRALMPAVSDGHRGSRGRRYQMGAMARRRLRFTRSRHSVVIAGRRRWVARRPRSRATNGCPWTA